MDTEALVIVVALAWGVLMLRRIHLKRRKRMQQKGSGTGTKGGAAPHPSPNDAERSMPRVGTPGSMTRNQQRALSRNNFNPDKQWSFEEAALFLDAVLYLQAVCRNVAESDDGPPPMEVQNDLLRLILTRQDLRDHVRKWGEDRREMGLKDDDLEEPKLPRNRQYDQVAEAARDHLIS